MAKHTIKGNRFLKALWLIPILVLGYVGWMNLVVGSTVTHLIDVGGEDTIADARFTGPFDRISGKKQVSSTSFRELEKDLVYFEVWGPGLEDADDIGVKVRFKDNFPQDAKFMLGAKNKQEWSYYWKDIYIPFYRHVDNLPLIAKGGNVKVYATSKESSIKFQGLDDFLQNPPLGSVIARNDKSLNMNQRPSLEESVEMTLDNFTAGDTFPVVLDRNASENGYLEIDISFRGSHSFYFFASNDSLELKVTKRDLNGYEGADELHILVYSLDGELKGEAKIVDDGNTSKGWEMGEPLSGTLRIDGLEPGVYQLELKAVGTGSDLMITRLELNQPKLIAIRRVALAGNFYLRNELVPNEPGPMDMWCYLYTGSEIKFLTYHEPSLQTITITGKDFSETIDIDSIHPSFYTTTLEPGIYHITLEKGDIIIEVPHGYFAFTKESIFLPSSSTNRRENGLLLINTALRGRHTLWAFVTNSTLELKVNKQDLNWYEGEDKLEIMVNSLDGTLKGSTIIPDDGCIVKGGMGEPQSGTLRIDGMEPGVYRIEFKAGGDLLIKKIEINQEKLVVGNRVYLVGMNAVYFGEGLTFDPVNLYSKNFRADKLGFRTWHEPGLQRITIRGDGFYTEVDVNKLDTDFNISLEPGAYQLTASKQDITIESNGYFSFTPDSFFLPKRCEVIGFKYDLSWVKENTDYIIVNYGNYVPPVEDNGWMVVQASWQRKDLFVTDNSLNFSLRATHFSGEETQKDTIPIDWIEITVQRLPILERMGWIDQLLGWIDTIVEKLPIGWRSGG